MRLSEWRKGAPNREALGTRVLAIVDPVLVALGAGADPECWVAWGDDPARYTILAPTPTGLVVCHVRVTNPPEGPRAAGKLVRWNRVQVGELAIETQAAHRLLAFQVEGQILRGIDDEADRIAAFALRLFAAADGRPAQEATPAGRRSARAASNRATPGTSPTGTASAATASAGNGAGPRRRRDAGD